jgi:hypothetical protein
MSIEFDIACLRCPVTPDDTIGVVQLIARAKLAADKIEEIISERDLLLGKLTHAATDYIDQNGCKPIWWTDDIVEMVKPK